MLDYILHKGTASERLQARSRLVDPHVPRTVHVPQVGLSLLPEEHQWVCNFNDRLTPVDGNSRMLRIGSAKLLDELLAFYYGSDNPLAPAATVFPYLHGLHSNKQRLFFESNESPQELYRLAAHAHYPRRPRMPHHSHFLLMAVDAGGSTAPRIANSVAVADILTPQRSSDDTSVHIEYAELPSRLCDREVAFSNHTRYEKFGSRNVCRSDDINNRNLAGQVKIAAASSHFLVFSNNMDWVQNLEVARVIQALAKHDKTVYIVDFLPADWDDICPEFLDQEPQSAYPKLLQWEQSSIWKVNSIKWAFPGVCLGTATDFSYLSRSTKHNFRVYVNCHERAQFPSPQSLDSVFADIHTQADCNPLYIEFPSSGLILANSLSETEMLSILKTLQLVRYFTQIRKQDVFVFCIDGFSGLSLFTIALGLFLTNSGSVDDTILDLMGTTHKSCVHRDDLRLYFYRHDYVFLRQFSRHIQAAKSAPVDPKTLIDAVETPKTDVVALPSDWFDVANDNNFPSKMVDNIYLGSHAHASSPTILRAMGFTKVVSMGEQPDWFADLPVRFECEADSGGLPVVPPLFLSAGCSVYVVNLGKDDRIAELPDLDTVVYVHNLRDDGRDSLWPVLVASEEVQAAVLGPSHECAPTLVHCRIGVSRSASVVIARLIKYHRMSFLEAYMYVRVRRLNIIIQPNLRFLYELFLYEQHHGRARRQCWWTVCREIDRLNRHYIA